MTGKEKIEEIEEKIREGAKRWDIALKKSLHDQHDQNKKTILQKNLKQIRANLSSLISALRKELDKRNKKEEIKKCEAKIQAIVKKHGNHILADSKYLQESDMAGTFTETPYFADCKKIWEMKQSLYGILGG